MQRIYIGGRVFVVISNPVEYSSVRADGKYPNRLEVDPLKRYQSGLKRRMSYGVVKSQNEDRHRHHSVLYRIKDDASHRDIKLCMFRFLATFQ